MFCVYKGEKMLWTGSAVLVICLLIPTIVSRHIDRDHTRGTTEREDESQKENRSWQLTKTHLRLHSKPPRILHVTEGDNEFLECQAAGTPHPVIHWLKDGKIIPQSEWERNQPVSTSIEEDDNESSINKMEISSTSSRLYLDCISSSDEAEYTCVAENPYHRSSTTTEVSVSSSDKSSCQGRKEHGQAPRIYAWTKTMIENQGQKTKLICRADGYPKPTIEWLGTKEENLATADISKYEISSDGDLIVRNLKWSDMGNYICVAENIHGTARAEAFLYPAIPDA